MELVKLYKELEEVISQQNESIAEEAWRLREELAIDHSGVLENHLKGLEEENKLLKIGILGRVKSGKSSLLNALLFDGQSVLPKAATPMTAALTTVTYGDQLEAQVEFYSEDDIAKLKSEHKKFCDAVDMELRERQDKIKDKSQHSKSVKTQEELKQQVIKIIKRNNFILASSYEQFEMMQKSERVEFAEQSGKIRAKSIDALAKELRQYVSAEGKYTPYTKIVHLKINQKNLEDIVLVDTPGINDPIQSREQRTRDYIKSCDVVFVTSPAGQFISAQDIELMDRISMKEGISELYVVASQVDTQLYGNEIKEMNLDSALNKITTALAEQLSSTMKNQKKIFPEVGNVYDQLVEESGQRIILSAGICESIKNYLNNGSELDDGIKKAWENLYTDYPDYFSHNDKDTSIVSLSKLSNIKKLNAVLDDVRGKKNSILEEKQINYIKVKEENLQKYKSELLKFIDEKIKDVENSDIVSLNKKIISLEKLQKDISKDIEDMYYEAIDELNYSGAVDAGVNAIFDKTKGQINDSKQEQTSSYRRVKDTIWDSFKNCFSDRWGCETVCETYAVVNAGAIKWQFEDLVIKIEKLAEGTLKAQTKNLHEVLRRELVDCSRGREIDISANDIKRAVRNVIQSLDLPQLSYSEMPEVNKVPLKQSKQCSSIFWNTLLKEHEVEEHTNSFISVWLQDYSGPLTGKLERSQAENFITIIQNGIRAFRRKLDKDINNYENETKKKLMQINFSEMLFENFRKEVDKLKHDIENKKATLESYERAKTKIIEVG